MDLDELTKLIAAELERQAWMSGDFIDRSRSAEFTEVLIDGEFDLRCLAATISLWNRKRET